MSVSNFLRVFCANLDDCKPLLCHQRWVSGQEKLERLKVWCSLDSPNQQLVMSKYQGPALSVLKREETPQCTRVCSPNIMARRRQRFRIKLIELPITLKLQTRGYAS